MTKLSSTAIAARAEKLHKMRNKHLKPFAGRWNGKEMEKGLSPKPNSKIWTIIEMESTIFYRYFNKHDIDFFKMKNDGAGGEYWFQMNYGHKAVVYLIMENGEMPDDIFIICSTFAFRDNILLMGKLKDNVLRDTIKESMAEYWIKVGEGLA